MSSDPSSCLLVAGRRPLSDFDGLLKDWRTGGGDTIRAELESAFADG